MNLSAKKILAARSLDLRVDLLRGFANWFLFLDHIPHNVVNLLTLRNFGFSGATDVFVFVAGYAAAIFFGKMAQERGFVVTATRMLRRMWQLYAAYVVLFVIYIDIISNVAAQYVTTEIIDEYNVIGLVDHPIRTLMHGRHAAGQAAEPRHAATLRRADGVLPAHPVVGAAPAEPHACGFLCALCRRARVRLEPAVVPVGKLVFQSVLLAAAVRARHLVRAERRKADGSGASSALAALRRGGLPPVRVRRDRCGPCAGGRGHAAGFRPRPVHADDKENLAFYRVLHLLALALLFTYLVPRYWPALRSRLLQPVMKCGEEWLSCFCVGVFLSFAAHFILITGPDSVAMQVLVSATGIAMMTAIAYYFSWSRRQDGASVRSAEA